MFWNKCSSNRQMIIFGMPGADFVDEVDMKGLANSFNKLTKRINLMEKGVSNKVDQVTREVTALQTHNKSMNDKMDEILKHLKAKK
jgi:hypothetical protein